MTRLAAAMLAIVLAALTAALAQAPPRPDHLARGRQLYKRHCAGCHGPEGRGDGYKLLGGDPANLTAPSTSGKTDRDLLTTIQEGAPKMPAWKHRFYRAPLGIVISGVGTWEAPVTVI